MRFNYINSMMQRMNRAVGEAAEMIKVLDEATSALVQGALENLTRGRTSIVMARRLSIVAALDLIVVLKNGAVVEDCTHAELNRAGGTYESLWDHQTGTFLEVGQAADNLARRAPHCQSSEKKDGPTTWPGRPTRAVSADYLPTPLGMELTSSFSLRSVSISGKRSTVARIRFWRVPGLPHSTSTWMPTSAYCGSMMAILIILR